MDLKNLITAKVKLEWTSSKANSLVKLKNKWKEQQCYKLVMKTILLNIIDCKDDIKVINSKWKFLMTKKTAISSD